MAALGERDLRRILGNEYDQEINAGPAAGILKRQRQRKDTLEDRKFTALAAILMSMGLLISAWFTEVGHVFVIQIIVAAVLAGAGALWYMAALKLDRRPDRP